MPIANTSARRSIFSDRACSGAMYATLPLSCPVRVTARRDAARAMPKSVMRETPSTLTRMLCGDTSRWTISSERPSSSVPSWAACSPASASSTMRTATRGGDLLLLLRGAVEEVPGRVALHVLHDEVVPGVGRPDLEDGDDVRVVDARGEAGLVEEHLDELGVPRQVLVEPLDGVKPLKAPRAAEAREKNRPHPPARELRDQLEPIELRSNHLRHDDEAPDLAVTAASRALFCSSRSEGRGVPPGITWSARGRSLYGGVA